MLITRRDYPFILRAREVIERDNGGHLVGDLELAHKFLNDWFNGWSD
jgi:hypothetical protein